MLDHRWDSRCRIELRQQQGTFRLSMFKTLILCILHTVCIMQGVRFMALARPELTSAEARKRGKFVSRIDFGRTSSIKIMAHMIPDSRVSIMIPVILLQRSSSLCPSIWPLSSLCDLNLFHLPTLQKGMQTTSTTRIYTHDHNRSVAFCRSRSIVKISRLDNRHRNHSDHAQTVYCTQ